MPYYLVDLYRIEDDYIMSTNTLLDNILELDKNRRSGSLPEILDAVLKRLQALEEEDRVSFRKWMEHVLLSAARGAGEEKIKVLLEVLKGGDAQMIHGLQMIMMDEYEAGQREGEKKGKRLGRKEGRKEGRQEGKHEGREEMNTLTGLLLRDNRMEDLKRSLADRVFQQELLEEYGIISFSKKQGI